MVSKGNLCLELPVLSFLIGASLKIYFYFLLAYVNCTKGFHCDISIHLYNVL
jgi:hypothetical protein